MNSKILLTIHNQSIRHAGKGWKNAGYKKHKIYITAQKKEEIKTPKTKTTSLQSKGYN
jgi:hypothetical protein